MQKNCQSNFLAFENRLVYPHKFLFGSFIPKIACGPSFCSVEPLWWNQDVLIYTPWVEPANMLEYVFFNG